MRLLSIISKEGMITHISSHFSYPATKKEMVVEACNHMVDAPAADRVWFEQYLPEGTYLSVDEVIKVLKL